MNTRGLWLAGPCLVCGAEQDDGRRQHDVGRHERDKDEQATVERRAAAGSLEVGACGVCKTPFEVGRQKGRRYCSEACRKRAWKAGTASPIPTPQPSRPPVEISSAGKRFSGASEKGPDLLPGTLAWERHQHWLALEASLPSEPPREWYAEVRSSGEVRHALVPAKMVPELTRPRPWTAAELDDLGPNLRAFVLDRAPQLAVAWRRIAETRAREPAMQAA